MKKPIRKRPRPSTRTSQRVRVGGVYMGAGQVRAELDRVDVRMVGLKRDIARHLPANDPLAETFRDFYQRWHAFYVDAYADWLAWGSNVDQAQNFDAELDAFARQYTEASGRRPSTPTRSTTVPRMSPRDIGRGIGQGIGGAFVALGVVAAVVVGAYALKE